MLGALLKFAVTMVAVYAIIISTGMLLDLYKKRTESIVWRTFIEDEEPVEDVEEETHPFYDDDVTYEDEPWCKWCGDPIDDYDEDDPRTQLCTDCKRKIGM